MRVLFFSHQGVQPKMPIPFYSFIPLAPAEGCNSHPGKRTGRKRFLKTSVPSALVLWPPACVRPTFWGRTALCFDGLESDPAVKEQAGELYDSAAELHDSAAELHDSAADQCGMAIRYPWGSRLGGLHSPEDLVLSRAESPEPRHPAISDSFPHIITRIVRNLSGDDLLMVRDVSRDWRLEADPRLLRHVRLCPADRTRPLYFFSPGGRQVPVPLTGDSGRTLAMLKKHCRVVDCDDDLGPDPQRSASLTLDLPNLEVLRRYGRSDGRLRIRTRTLVDFGASSLFAEPLRTYVNCDRYVVPNLAYAREDWREPKISKLQDAGYQSIAAVSFAQLVGLTSYTVREVVVLFVEGEAAELDEAFMLVKDGCSQMMLNQQPVPTITFVGLRANDRRGDSLLDQLEEYIPITWAAFGVGTSSFRFLSHAEYRALVGDEQYGLETDRCATLW